MKKRKLLSIVLSLCMALALMPQMVFAEEPGNYDELQGIMNDARYGGTVTLTKDYTINNTVTAYDTTLDLNGHVIKMTGNGSVIKVEYGNFTLQDNSEGKTGAITGGHTTGSGGGVDVEQGNFVMEGGTIYDCRASCGGGCVHVGGGSFTMKGGIIDGGVAPLGGGVWIDGSSFTMEGGVIDSGNDFASNDVVDNQHSTFNANGGVVKSIVILSGQINNTAPYGGTIFYGDSNKFGPINGKTVTFKKDDNSTYAVEVVKNGNKAIEPTIKPDAPEGKKFAGWYTDKTLITSYDFDSDVTNDIILYARFDPIISITVPFTTKVELGGNMQPDETVFNMQVLDSNGDKYSSGNVKIEAKPVTTNGAGSYNGEITFTGTESEIFNMFKGNRYVFVKQEDADYTNWDVDDTVWCLFHSGIAELSEGEVEPSPIVIIPATSKEDGEDMYYDPVFPEDDEIQPYKIIFTNTYTKSEAGMVEPEGTTGGNSDNGNGSKADTEDSAKTGDDTNLALWLALMLLSGAGITGVTAYTRRKRTNE